MKLVLLCSALLAAWACCDVAQAVSPPKPAKECVTYNKDSKIGSCYPNRGFTPNADYIGKEGDEGCAEKCREKGFIDGCCAQNEHQECYCALARTSDTPKN